MLDFRTVALSDITPASIVGAVLLRLYNQEWTKGRAECFLPPVVPPPKPTAPTPAMSLRMGLLNG